MLPGQKVTPFCSFALQVTAYSPTGRPLGCPVSDENGTYFASFQPDEAGEWRIHVTYDGSDIENSPFRCMAFDPRAIFVSLASFLLRANFNTSSFQIPDQDSARRAIPGEPFTFTVDAAKTGWGEVAIDVVYENRSIRRTFYVEEIANRVYKVRNEANLQCWLRIMPYAVKEKALSTMRAT